MKNSINYTQNPTNPMGSLTDKKVIDKLAEGLKKYPQVAIL